MTGAEILQEQFTNLEFRNVESRVGPANDSQVCIQVSSPPVYNVSPLTSPALSPGDDLLLGQDGAPDVEVSEGAVDRSTGTQTVQERHRTVVTCRQPCELQALLPVQEDSVVSTGLVQQDTETVPLAWHPGVEHLKLVVVDEQSKGLAEFIIIFEPFNKPSSAVFIILVAFVCDGPDPVGFTQLYQRMNRIVQVEILSYLESHANSQLGKLLNIEPSYAILLWILMGAGSHHWHLSQFTLQADHHRGEN